MRAGRVCLPPFGGDADGVPIGGRFLLAFVVPDDLLQKALPHQLGGQVCGLQLLHMVEVGYGVGRLHKLGDGDRVVDQ